MNLFKEYWTLGFLLQENEVWLARHARGPFEGFLNGYGGKGRTFPELTQAREIRKESGVIVVNAEQVALFDMYNAKKTNKGVVYVHRQLHVYLVDDFLGTPHSSAEMSEPTRYAVERIPREELIPGDREWLELLLRDRIQLTGMMRMMST